METLETGASTAEASNGDSATEQTDESTTSDTSTDGTQEDADTLRQRIADKDKHIVKLETELREGKPKKKSEAVTEDQDDVMTWMTLNTDSLKLVGKEFQEELAFYKSHKIPVTNEIRDRALRDARARKGIGSSTRNAEAERQASTSTEVAGEMRKTSSRDVPESIKKLYPNMTPERFAQYKAELDAKKKR